MTILDRRHQIDALSALILAVQPKSSACPLSEVAIGLDANALLRLTAHRRSAAMIDYLGSRHAAPLVLPGQAIQEFWSNQLSAVQTVAKTLSVKFSDLADELSKLGPEYNEQVSELQAGPRQVKGGH
jgi:hypothetical protein